MIKLVVFDMAGTTVNEDNIVYKTLQKAINLEGFNFSLLQVLTEGAGKEKLQAIKSVLSVYGSIENDSLANKIYSNFLDLLDSAYEEAEIIAQKNAVELFSELRKNGVFVVLNTGYNVHTANSLIKKLGWREGIEFDALITASDVSLGRPNPEMILLAMEKYRITDPQEVIKVGDSIIDIEEGKNAGCRLNIGITTGAHTESQLESAHPDYILNDLLELLAIIKSIN